MIKTNLARDHALWNQITRKENTTRQQFEFMTGQTQADRFFSGNNKPFVDNNLKTCTDWRLKAETDYGNALQAASA